MLRIAKSLITILAVAAIAVGATGAYFSDTETSIGNTFSAGSLDLNIDGGNTNVVKFNVTNMRPGNQPKGSYTLANVGTINGYLDLESIAVTDTENGCVDPETVAGDITCDNPGVGQGELGDVVNLRLFVDRNGDGWISVGDTVFYNDKVANLPASFDLNEPINAGSSTKIVALLDWWSTPNDDLAQGDSMQLDITFELAQTTGQ
ncbi:MAG: CalY family protein [Candidatus Berkelbacteria bacterium]|nr:CalY family protein [Candidatus Berkelbacteria bacterium]